MTMSDHEITDPVRQMAAPPKPPTYGEAEVEELVRMHAGGRHKMRSEAEILARYNLGRQQYKQLKSAVKTTANSSRCSTPNSRYSAGCSGARREISSWRSINEAEPK